MKKYFVLLFSIVLVLILVGCSRSISTSKDGIGNITNVTNIANYEGWDYFRDNSDKDKEASKYCLYKRKDDNTQKIKLCEDDPYFISVVGDWIYYCNAKDGEKLYKIKIDGSNRMMITEESTWYPYVIGDWIYYWGRTENKIMKIKIDGTNKTKICDDYPNGSMYIADNWIYYSNGNDGQKLYKININGTDNKAYSINSINNWIYYADGNKLYKIETNGNNETKLCDDQVFKINIYNNKLYYINNKDNESIYKINLDGTSREKVSDKKNRQIIISNGWIYTFDADKSVNEYIRIKVD